MLHYHLKKSTLAVMVALAATAAQAAPLKLEDAAAKAVVSNPEVVAKWHQFQSSGYERDVAWGRYLPTLDVVFGTGYQKRESPLYSKPDRRAEI